MLLSYAGAATAPQNMKLLARWPTWANLRFGRSKITYWAMGANILAAKLDGHGGHKGPKIELVMGLGVGSKSVHACCCPKPGSSQCKVHNITKTKTCGRAQPVNNMRG